MVGDVSDPAERSCVVGSTWQSEINSFFKILSRSDHLHRRANSSSSSKNSCSAEADETKFFGPSARKFFSRKFFFGSADGGGNKQTKTSENLELWRKSRTLAKISDFGENLELWRKSRTLGKIPSLAFLAVPLQDDDFG